MKYDLILRSASFAADKHRHQRRKDVESLPYINHPLDVATVLACEGSVTDVDLLMAALLHDTVEDTDTSNEELVERFGERVASIVREVTDDKSLPKQQRKKLQIEHAPLVSNEAKQLKLADKICNVRDIDVESPAGWTHARKFEYLDWADQVIAGCRGVNDALERRFDEAVAETRHDLGKSC